MGVVGWDKVWQNDWAYAAYSCGGVGVVSTIFTTDPRYEGRTWTGAGWTGTTVRYSDPHTGKRISNHVVENSPYYTGNSWDGTYRRRLPSPTSDAAQFMLEL